jgi:uncharacterized coiled-coil protein SlyX
MAGSRTLFADETNIDRALHLLQQQNETLQSQLRQQQQMIESLNRAVAELKQAGALRDRELQDVKETVKEPEESARSSRGFNFGKINISGEGGVGVFETGREGAFPNAEFRVDEAKLFVDAPVWSNVYAYAELNLASHEGSDLNLNLGELYLDFEDVSQLWGRDHQLNIRVGRLDIPFGEEYISRDAIDNPLISHSLVDFWGVDEGLELYGSFGKLSYVLAVQNGGVSDTRDFTADKSIAGRLSYDPKRWLHLSLSGMRTGNLDANTEGLSALWFGGGWYRSLGSTDMTTFHANMVQGDVEFHLPHGNVKMFGGYIRYDDNDSTANNGRDVYYYSIEGTRNITRKLYASARFSQIFSRGGFPVVGNGNMDSYLFGPLTEDIWRLSLGLGYRWNKHLVVKSEYSLERGRETGGEKRNHEDFLGAEAAFGF